MPRTCCTPVVVAGITASLLAVAAMAYALMRYGIDRATGSRP